MSQAYTEHAIQPFATEWRLNSLSSSVSAFDRLGVAQESAFGSAGMAGYEAQIAEFLQGHEKQIELLRTSYVFHPDEGVRSFLSGHRAVAEVLIEAVPELRRCFGNMVTLQLQLLDDDETPAAIYGIVLWQGDLAGARGALQTFDETWWIEKSRTAAGRIVFDYQLV
jgi:hypothetical protein